MKNITNEWVVKAEGDFVTARREMQAEPPNYDAVVFHAQQCVEKYLKARLVEEGIDFPKTHDLTAILNMLLAKEPAWDHLQPALDALTSIGVEVRYPGTFADADDSREALQTAQSVRDLVRPSLGLSL
ncbi:MAG: HEPN domain-containing protein [Pseudomonadota bacterium]